MGTNISKGGFDSEEKGGTDKWIDWTAHTIKGVLKLLLASDVLGDCGGACIHEQCSLCASFPEDHPYQPPRQSPEDLSIGLFVLCLNW